MSERPRHFLDHQLPEDLVIFTETEEESMAVAAATRAARADITLTRPVTEEDEKWIRVLRTGWVAGP